MTVRANLVFEGMHDCIQYADRFEGDIHGLSNRLYDSVLTTLGKEKVTSQSQLTISVG